MYMKSTQFMPPPLTGEGVYRSVRYMHNRILFSHPVVFLRTSFLNYCLLKGGKVYPPKKNNKKPTTPHKRFNNDVHMYMSCIL